MVDGNLFIPLSPPSSPRMSAYNATSAENEWQNQDIKPLDPTSTNSEGDMAMLHAEVSGLPLDMQRRPMLRTHRSFPYTIRPSGHSLHPSDHSLDGSGGSPVPQRERITISKLEELDSGELSNVTFNGSAPASPVSRLTPPSPCGERSDEHEDTHEGGTLSGDGGEDEQNPPISAAELRAQKRKMKRFRSANLKTRTSISLIGT
jgi:hypothetical protein